MKIKKKLKKNSLINLNFLKHQIYNVNESYSNNFKINHLNSEIKQVLKIIYLYNIKNKKILFVGFPYNKLITNQLKHLFVSKNVIFNSSIKINNYDLIVFIKTKSEDETILKNLTLFNLPLIVLGNDNTSLYNVNGIFKSKKLKSFCYFLVFSVLKTKI